MEESGCRSLSARSDLSRNAVPSPPNAGNVELVQSPGKAGGFPAIIRTTKEMLAKHGQPTEEEKSSIAEAMAEAIVLKNQGTSDPSEVSKVKIQVERARAGIAQLFQEDGHRQPFASALAHVCVAWDYDAYKNGNVKNNLTLNYLLKYHAGYAGLFNEQMLFGEVKGSDPFKKEVKGSDPFNE